MLSPRKEVEQLVDFVRKLHDRQALEKRESRRRFLGGEGFVSWPGPALRQFFDQIIVHNRMVSGGLVIDQQMVSLSDIRCPILYFVGNRDEFARPPSVRAIEQAAPHAACHEIKLRAGHFGLVVGSTALRDTWPSVVSWVRWHDGDGDEPPLLRTPAPAEPWHDEPEELFEVDFDYDLLTDEVAHAVKRGWQRAGQVYRDASDTLHGLRHQLPRLRRLERMRGDTRVSPSRTLAEQAARIGERTFFLWKGRAFSYRDADARVSNVARGLLARGVRPGDRVAVLMGVRPSHLSAVTALNRIGAVAVMLSPSLSDDGLADALKREPTGTLITDRDHATRARAAHDGALLVLGAGDGALPAGAVDMEAIDPDAVAPPAWHRADPGVARDLAMILVRPGRGGSAKLSRISNGRWAFSALGVSSAATLTPADTVYCCLPIHHPTGIMVSVGGALVSGARLALSTGFDAASFWDEVRRYGVSVVFYAGEMARALCDAAPVKGERDHPVRLFAGSGMRRDVWQRLRERFGVGVMEFYASTERNLVLANASGEKMGALGRLLPGSAELAIARYDFAAGDFVKRGDRLRRCHADEAGVALVRVREHVGGPGVMADVFERGDRWLRSGDVLRRDRDGDHWFVDRLANMWCVAGVPVATPRIEDALYGLTEVTLAVAYAHDGELVADVMSREPLEASRFSARLALWLGPHERPRVIRRVAAIGLTEGFNTMKAPMRSAGVEVLQTLTYDEAAQRYA
jgi:putative long chain acyl-CoA synthase